MSAATDKARRLLSDLDRCEHGRHDIDPCFECPDRQSAGNLIKVVGHGLHGYDLTVDDVKTVLSAVLEENAGLTEQVSDLARRL